MDRKQLEALVRGYGGKVEEDDGELVVSHPRMSESLRITDETEISDVDVYLRKATA